MPLESEKDVYIDLISKLSGVNKDMIKRQLMTTKIEENSRDIDISSQMQSEQQKTKNYDAEMFVLASILHKKPYTTSVEIDDFVNNNFKMFYKYLLDNNFPAVSKIFDDFDLSANRDLKLLVDYNFDNIKKPEDEFSGCLLKMQLNRLVLEQEQLNDAIQKCTDEREKMVLLEKVTTISKKIIEKKTLLNKVG